MDVHDSNKILYIAYVAKKKSYQSNMSKVEPNVRPNIGISRKVESLSKAWYYQIPLITVQTTKS